ncbi:MAG: hypothetical protein PF694_07970 [Bacteroidetes bacterium]|jgi:hypothetical protein|nr:hypothetical protein [Bacteroidota bacterium]
MKHLVKLPIIAVALLFLFTACNKDKEEADEPIFEGIYEGTLTGSQLKSTKGNAESKPASTEISITGENKIQVHCYAEGFDTTFVMNYYHHNNSVYICYTGDDFEEMYGHMLGEDHDGGMMDDMHNGETQWMHHMSEEHDEGDEHFGGFDMANHSFSYTFQMNLNGSSDDMYFEGIKQ